MEVKSEVNNTKRSTLLHTIASNYVKEALGRGNFDAIPYVENVSLRAPICPGGSAVPLTGKENLRDTWWAPLPDLVKKVWVLDTHVNQDLTQVTVEFHCEIKNRACTLRIIDRFKVNEDGKITEQENFFDPRNITNPGWNDN